VLGVRPELRDAILAGDPGGAGPARWFRSPAGAHEPERWDLLAAARPFARAVGACYAPSPVAGGAITWSAWRRSPALNTALPAPGLDWQLQDPGRGGAVCFDGNGILTSTAAPAEAIGQPLLGRLAGEQLWVTSIGAHRDGQRLPGCEIEALAATRPEVWTSALVDDARAGAVLIVFARPDRVDGDQAARDRIAGEIAELIDVELGPHLAPPRIEVFTVSPHLDDAIFFADIQSRRPNPQYHCAATLTSRPPARWFLIMRQPAEPPSPSRGASLPFIRLPPPANLGAAGGNQAAGGHERRQPA